MALEPSRVPLRTLADLTPDLDQGIDALIAVHGRLRTARAMLAALVRARRVRAQPAHLLDPALRRDVGLEPLGRPPDRQRLTLALLMALRG